MVVMQNLPIAAQNNYTHKRTQPITLQEPDANRCNCLITMNGTRVHNSTTFSMVNRFVSAIWIYLLMNATPISWATWALLGPLRTVHRAHHARRDGQIVGMPAYPD
jgi:hypothetical protein